MALEIVGMAIILFVWLMDMNERHKSGDKNSYMFLIAYVAGFAILAAYAMQNRLVSFGLFFMVIALISLIEFASMMVRRK